MVAGKLNLFEIYLLALTSIAYLALGTLVIVKNPGSVTNRVMLSFTLVAALWSFSVLMINIQHYSYPQVLFWVRLSHAAAIILPWHVYTLAISLFRGKPFSSRSVTVLLIVSLGFAIIAMTPCFVTGIAEPFEERGLEFGYFALAYFTFYSGAFGYVIYLLYRKLSLAKGLARIQMFYFAIGIITTIILSSLANIVFPLFGLIYIAGIDVRNLGPTFSLILIGSISYGIVKHRLMDIRFALRRNLALMVTVTVLVGLLMAVFRLLQRWGGMPAVIGVETVIVLVTVVVLIVLPPMKEKIQVFLDTYFFKRVTDYHSSLLYRARQLVSMLDLEDLLGTLTFSIVQDMDLEYGYYCYRAGPGAILSGTHGPVSRELGGLEQPPWLSPDLAAYVEQQKDVVLLSDLKKVKPVAHRETLRQEIESYRAEAIVPLFTGSSLEGFICLGAKRSGEPFFLEDIRLLSMLASQVDVALKNGRLYHDLLAVKQYMQGIVANMGEGLIAVNAREEITVYNKAAEMITGTPVADAMGKRLLSALGSELYELYRQVLLSEQGWLEEEFQIGLESGIRHVKCNVSQLKLPESEYPEVIMVLSNVTRVKELEKEKSRAQRLVSLGEMAAAIAHEIKNPLVAIKTYADLLPEKHEDSIFRNAFSRLVGSEVTRINNLVTELLSFVKEDDLCYEEVNLPVLLDEVVMLIALQAGNSNVVLHNEYTKGLGFLKADRNLIKQALLNICYNALQAMPGGGELTIGVSPSTAVQPNALPAEEKQSLEEGNTPVKEITIWIKDTGIGISESIREKMFEPFVTNKSDGTGLGLSISHKIVNAHGGRISYYPNENKGTVFAVTLPFAGRLDGLTGTSTMDSQSGKKGAS